MNESQRRKARGIPTRPPDGEFERRIEHARGVLGDHDADAAVIYGTGPAPDPIRYLTGYVHVFPRARSVFSFPEWPIRSS